MADVDDSAILEDYLDGGMVGDRRGGGESHRLLKTPVATGAGPLLRAATAHAALLSPASPAAPGRSMASLPLQARSVAVTSPHCEGEGSDQEGEEWNHTKTVWRNLPKRLIREVDSLPETTHRRTPGCARAAKLMPCLRTELLHGIWYREQPSLEVLPRQPNNAHEYLYARLVTLATYHRTLGMSSVRSIFSVLGHYSLLNMAGDVVTSKEYADVPPSLRWVFAGFVALPIIVWGGMCGYAAWRELQSHQRTGDYAVHEWTERLKDLAYIFIFQLLAIPRSVKDAPILYHTRKPTQPFCAIKLHNRRMWILGYMCEEQSVFEEDQGQENQLPLYLSHIPVFFLQAYMAFWLGTWSASSVLTLLVSFTFLFMNLRNFFILRDKKGVYQAALEDSAKEIEDKILNGLHQNTDLDKLGVVDKLLERDFGRRCSSDPQVQKVLEAYTDRCFRGQQCAAACPQDGSDDEEYEEISALIGCKRSACCSPSKAASREDGSSQGSSRTGSRSSEVAH